MSEMSDELRDLQAVCERLGVDDDGVLHGAADRIEQLQQQVDAVLEICREISDDWAPEHPPYAAQDMIERIREKLGDE